jgi:hypothetical protein
MIIKDNYAVIGAKISGQLSAMIRRDRHRPDLDARLAALRQPHSNPDCLYHAITLTADEELRVEFGVHSIWVGYADTEHRIELRQSRLVYSDHVKVWQAMELPYSIILTADDLTLFLVGGGCALVEKELAERAFGELLGPSQAVPFGLWGFKALDLLTNNALRKAPTPRLRMQVLTRDRRRCRICGRRPDDNTDIVLHVHHIRPWAKGGITDPANLITLCHTCHDGLEPHFDRHLFKYIEDGADSLAISELSQLKKGVARYRKVGLCGTPRPGRGQKTITPLKTRKKQRS